MGRRGMVVCALAVMVAACRSVYTLVPTPGAAGAPLPVSARVLRVSITKDLTHTGAALEPDSRIAVELEVRNADATRPAMIGRLALLVRDALGGPDVYAGPIDTGPFTLRPGETVTVWRTFVGFPPDGPSGPLRATVFVPVEGQPPLALAIVDPVPGGPRWVAPSARAAIYVTGGTGGFGAHDTFYDPLGLSWRDSFGRFIWGIDYRWSARHRELAGGNLWDSGFSLLGEAQWQPWRFPLGLYLEGGAFVGSGRSDGKNAGQVLFPRASAGLALGAGRTPPETLFPVVRPRSPQRTLAMRFGYTQWFNTGDGWGAHGIQVSLEAMVAP